MWARRTTEPETGRADGGNEAVEVAEVIEGREPSLKGRVTGQEGQGLVEYSLVLLLVAAALAGTLGAYGTVLIGQYTAIVALIP
jgi:hypothetical protein